MFGFLLLAWGGKMLCVLCVSCQAGAGATGCGVWGPGRGVKHQD